MSDLLNIQFLILAISWRFEALEKLVKVKTKDFTRSQGLKKKWDGLGRWGKCGHVNFLLLGYCITLNRINMIVSWANKVQFWTHN